MARADKGTALFASLEEHNLEKKVMQQLQDALQPAFTGNTQTRFDNMAINDFNRLLKRYQHKLGRLRGTFYYSNFSKTEMNLMGYGKPLEEPVAAVPSEKPEMKLPSFLHRKCYFLKRDVKKPQSHIAASVSPLIQSAP